MANIVVTLAGRGKSLTIIFVVIPSVPSEPINSPLRSKPADSGVFPPSHIVSPFAVTISIPRTWLVVTPNAKQCGPPAFSAMFPPIVQAFCELGSGA